MTRVYLAGPINGCTDDEANGWRAEVKRLRPTIVWIDPMSRDYRGKEDESVEDIVDGDCADIRRSNAVLANCERASWGTAMELHYAHSIGRRVIAVVPAGAPVSPWLRFHARIAHSFEEAAELLGAK